MKLTIIIPTRGRPAILAETITTLIANMTEPDTQILVCVDRDDETTQHYPLPQGHRVFYSVQDREDTRGLKYDRALTEAPADVYLVAVDHTGIHTKGFDRIILEAAALFPDGIGVVCTPMANASFPFLQAVTAKWVEITGNIQPPQFPYWFIDHWTDDVARMTGRYAMVDIAVESNRRPGNTIGMRDLIFWASYFDALQPVRRDQANRLIDAMDEPDWRKQMLRQSFPMIEYRSHWVNDICRADAATMTQSRGDNGPRTEGYLRALKAAVEDWQRLLPPDEMKAAA